MVKISGLFPGNHVMSRVVVYFALLSLVLARTLSGEARQCGCSSTLSDRIHRYSLIFGFFPNTHVVLINWRSSSLAYFAALLLLCGDVSQNPGPSVSFPCGVCSLEVSDDYAAMCCDNCDQWIHVSCDTSLSMDEYNAMVSNPSTEPWFCYSCKGPITENTTNNFTSVNIENNSIMSFFPAVSPLRTLKCWCFNARSIVNKRFDLLGKLSALSPDIIMITETHLDNAITDCEVVPPNYTDRTEIVMVVAF